MAELSKTRKELKAVKDILAKEKLNQVKASDTEPGMLIASKSLMTTSPRIIKY